MKIYSILKDLFRKFRNILIIVLDFLKLILEFLTENFVTRAVN